MTSRDPFQPQLFPDSVRNAEVFELNFVRRSFNPSRNCTRKSGKQQALVSCTWIGCFITAFLNGGSQNVDAYKLLFSFNSQKKNATAQTICLIQHNFFFSQYKKPQIWFFMTHSHHIHFSLWLRRQIFNYSCNSLQNTLQL